MGEKVVSVFGSIVMLATIAVVVGGRNTPRVIRETTRGFAAAITAAVRPAR
jgi:hypothetical protein